MNILVVSAARSEPAGHPRNIGDALLTESLCTYLRSTGATVLTAEFGPNDGPQSVSTSSLFDLATAIGRADRVIMGGGTLIQDDQSARSFAGLPRLNLSVALLCRASRTPLYYACVGVEEVVRRRARLALATSLRLARSVVARDAESARRAHSLTAREYVVGSDAALLSASPKPSCSVHKAGALLALNRTEVSKLSAAVVSALASEFGSVRLLSMDQSSNWDFRDYEVSGDRKAVVVVPPDRSVAEVIELVHSAEVIIASRMHALYLAALAAVPVIAVSSSTKVATFCEEFGLSPTALDRLARGAASLARVVDDARLEEVRARGRAAMAGLLA